MSPEEAHDLLATAGVEALVYTTPSHTPERPRWRVLCQFCCPLTPRERFRMVSRLNGVLGGVLSLESKVLSQSFYCGRVKGVPFVIYRTTGKRIDDLPELEAAAIPVGGKLRAKPRQPVPAIDQSGDPPLRELAASRLARSAQKVAETERGENRNYSINAQRDGGLVACNLLTVEEVVEKAVRGRA